MNSFTRKRAFLECQTTGGERTGTPYFTTCAEKKSQRSSEVETYPFSLWSHRAHWKGLASFCDSSGHASCKRNTGMRGTVQGRFTIHTLPFQVHDLLYITGTGIVSITMQIKHIDEKGVLFSKRVSFVVTKILTPCAWTLSRCIEECKKKKLWYYPDIHSSNNQSITKGS